MELTCAVQNYAWGVKGIKSSVAQFAKATQPDLEVGDDQPFAELWMGTHPSGPSVLKGSGVNLDKYISEHPEVLGSPVTEKFQNQLPFLFKVLSVNQALSIQAHPNKAHAEELHQSRPDVYKDPNHKPEMAIALTPFQALCGFRPQEEIAKHLTEIHELQNVIGTDFCDAFIKDSNEENLKKCFNAMMTASKDAIASALSDYLQRLSSLDSTKGNELLRDLFLTLHEKYPGDVGCFSIYLLNYFTLQPGEAMFLGPNVIHAYLYGDCVECMACSDNVVRAGLTPKYQDVETLINMLEYEMLPAELRKFKGSAIDKYTVSYDPPVPDFAVDVIEIPPGTTEYSLRTVDSASIIIIVEGQAKDLTISPSPPGEVAPVTEVHRGSVLFLGAEQSLSFKLDGNSRFLAFRALCIL
ncbi:mannose-6-phosphate isomerase-like [Macrobrachium nipponense]|uniref:mannose-6-phosphate isomerase-like n=1 Tax=Macrobrachium nipponense TaxID=159736 RepID=UPI0030C8A592